MVLIPVIRFEKVEKAVLKIYILNNLQWIIFNIYFLKLTAVSTQCIIVEGTTKDDALHHILNIMNFKSSNIQFFFSNLTSIRK